MTVAVFNRERDKQECKRSRTRVKQKPQSRADGQAPGRWDASFVEHEQLADCFQIKLITDRQRW